MIEILTLNLKPGIRDKFHQLYLAESLSLQKKWKIEVVAYGPWHDENSYYVIRSFKSLEDRQKLKMLFTAAMIVISAETFKGWSDIIKK